jgi:hypothetical protein
MVFWDVMPNNLVDRYCSFFNYGPHLDAAAKEANNFTEGLPNNINSSNPQMHTWNTTT